MVITQQPLRPERERKREREREERERETERERKRVREGGGEVGNNFKLPKFYNFYVYFVRFEKDQCLLNKLAMCFTCYPRSLRPTEL